METGSSSSNRRSPQTQPQRFLASPQTRPTAQRHNIHAEHVRDRGSTTPVVTALQTTGGRVNESNDAQPSSSSSTALLDSLDLSSPYGSFPPQLPSSSQVFLAMRSNLRANDVAANFHINPKLRTQHGAGPKPPQRTTKNSQKLVLLPESNNATDPAPMPQSPTALRPSQVHTPPFQYGINSNNNTVAHANAQAEHWLLDSANQQPMDDKRQDGSLKPQQQSSVIRQDNDVVVVPVDPAIISRTEAELMSKDKRTDIPRMTCYCAAESYKLDDVVRNLIGGPPPSRASSPTPQESQPSPSSYPPVKAGVSCALYDECLYISHDGEAAVWNVLLDVQGTQRPMYTDAVPSSASGLRSRRTNKIVTSADQYPQQPTVSPRSPGLEALYRGFPFSDDASGQIPPQRSFPLRTASLDDADIMTEEAAAAFEAEVAHQYQLQPRWMHRKEIFLFDFGVIVFWNFSEEEELRYISRLKSCCTNPIEPADFEIEDFHFQYDLGGPFQPRIYNDMITLKSSNHMIKLTISHAVAQSAKLSLFENIMEEEIASMSALPKMMAEIGEVKLPNGRNDVIKIVGKLFKLRMNVNLVSNVLDTPEIFWSEPELQGLYNAIRGYVEITQRVNVLNTRVEVISDLLDMLQDHLNGSEMTTITVIIIALIIVTCLVAVGEVSVKILRMRAGIPDAWL